MGSDDLFKKRRQAREARKSETREVKADSLLIVTEGTRTEPQYFKRFAEKIRAARDGNITKKQKD